MVPPKNSGFSEDAAEFDPGHRSLSGLHSFVQAERERLRAGQLDTVPVESAADPRVGDIADWPSPPIAQVSTHDLSRFGELWSTRHQTTIGILERGTGLHVDLGSGLYVTGKTRLEASDKFQAIFGTSRSAFSQEVGVPIRLGSGL